MAHAAVAADLHVAVDALLDLATKLAAIAGSRPDRQVYVRADQSVPYGEVMAVIGSIRDAGLAKVGLITAPPAERSR